MCHGENKLRHASWPRCCRSNSYNKIVLQHWSLVSISVEKIYLISLWLGLEEFPRRNWSGSGSSFGAETFFNIGFGRRPWPCSWLRSARNEDWKRKEENSTYFAPHIQIFNWSHFLDLMSHLQSLNWTQHRSLNLISRHSMGHIWFWSVTNFAVSLWKSLNFSASSLSNCFLSFNK